MSKKIVELKSKKKIELREMGIDEVDFCNDTAIMKYENGEISHISGLSKTRTAWLRRGIAGGDFKAFKKDQIQSDSKFIHARDCDTKTPYILDADTIQ